MADNQESKQLEKNETLPTFFTSLAINGGIALILLLTFFILRKTYISVYSPKILK